MKQKANIAILGATGVVGREITKIIDELKVDFGSIKFLSSAKSAGTKIQFQGNEYTVEEATPESFDGVNIVLASAGGSTSQKFAPEIVKRGGVLIDNSSAFRMDEDVPLVIAYVNDEDLRKHKGIIANPNCSTIQAVVALKPLDDKYHIKRIVYSTYQAVSGAGIKGVEDLENQTCDEKNLKKFPHPIFNNCLPHIDVFLENGYTKEEEKMINETRKILKRPDLKITATTVRVPVMNSHSESINIEFEKDFHLEDLISTLKHAPGIIIQDDPSTNTYPLALNANGHDEVFVGRIRRDDSIPSGINLWVVADNIRKGAASNAIQIVEKLISSSKLEN